MPGVRSPLKQREGFFSSRLGCAFNGETSNDNYDLPLVLRNHESHCFPHQKADFCQGSAGRNSTVYLQSPRGHICFHVVIL